MEREGKKAGRSLRIGPRSPGGAPGRPPIRQERSWRRSGVVAAGLLASAGLMFAGTAPPGLAQPSSTASLLLDPVSPVPAPEWDRSPPWTEGEVQIWFPRGSDPVFRRGEPVRIHFQADRDAHVAIVQLDTSGRLHLHFPSGPRDPQWIRGGQEYLLLVAGGGPWVVADGPGLGHFFILSSGQPLDWSRFGYTQDGGWELAGAVAPSYSDPNDAMDDMVWAVLPHWQEADFALAITHYRVER